MAGYLALSEGKEFRAMENLPIRVTDDGFTRIDPAGKAVDYTMAWRNLYGSGDLLARRIAGRAETKDR
jgi:hypothetical protein